MVDGVMQTGLGEPLLLPWGWPCHGALAGTGRNGIGRILLWRVGALSTVLGERETKGPPWLAILRWHAGRRESTRRLLIAWRVCLALYHMVSLGWPVTFSHRNVFSQIGAICDFIWGELRLGLLHLAPQFLSWIQGLGPYISWRRPELAW
jgi:hypothetical protein